MWWASRVVPNRVLIQLMNWTRLSGIDLTRSESWVANRLPKTTMNSSDAAMMPSRTIPEASPRRQPRLDSQATTGSMAIESSHASSMRNQKLPVDSQTHAATR